jgi:hypothetical protein
MKRTLLFVTWVGLASCAKQQEPAQAVEPAPQEDSPAEKSAGEGAAAPRAAEPALPSKEEEAPGAVAPAPAPPPRGGAGRGDLLEPEEAKKAKQLPVDVEAAFAELASSFSDLEKALSLSTPDCVTAKQLRDRVCDLAEHICRLADESSGSSVQQLCGDGRGRCADAKRRYGETCATP